MSDVPSHYLELLEAARLVASRDCSSETLTRALLERIRKVDGGLGAYVEVMEEEALACARLADDEVARGCVRGPLHGVPVAVKDIFHIEGHAMAAGMAMRADEIAAGDATAIRRLREAGAVLLGRLTLTEGAYAEHRTPYRAPSNPWNAQCWSGASSSGSAVAVAAGLAYATLASETGGSTKLPSAANGVTAIKPSWGRVSRHGMFELAASLDHVGIMTRSVSDLAVMLGTVAGPDPLDPGAAQRVVPDYCAALRQPIRGLKIGLDTAWTHDGVDKMVSDALENAVEVLCDMGAQVVPVTLPDPADMLVDWFGVCAVQTAIAHDATFPAREREYGPALAELLRLGHRLSGIDLLRMQSRRDAFRKSLSAVLDRVDVLPMPVMSIPTPTMEQMSSIDDDMIVAVHRFTCPFTMSGHPGIVMPCAFSPQGMPIAFQLVGRHFAEETLIRAGSAFQSQTHWHRMHPAAFD
ncbi:MAG TPA: amidase [Variovorax sp.]